MKGKIILDLAAFFRIWIGNQDEKWQQWGITLLLPGDRKFSNTTQKGPQNKYLIIEEFWWPYGP